MIHFKLFETICDLYPIFDRSHMLYTSGLIETSKTLLLLSAKMFTERGVIETFNCWPQDMLHLLAIVVRA